MVEDTRLSGAQLDEQDEQVWAAYPGDDPPTFEAAVAHHQQFPAEKRFADVIESADRVLTQPRAGVPQLDDQVELLRTLVEEGDADLLPVTIDSYTRNNEYGKAQEGLERSRETGEDELNGFPAVNHGVEGCRRLIDETDRPVQVSVTAHPTPGCLRPLPSPAGSRASRAGR